MKKFFSFEKWLVAMAILVFALGMAYAGTVGDDMTFEGPVDFKGSVINKSEVVTATNAITASECGKTFYLSSATEFVSTLPALSTVVGGCSMKFVVDAAPSGANYTVITGNSLENGIFGLAVVNGASVAGASEDTITFTGAAAVKGDWAEVESDGTSWYVSGQAVAATGITLTAAD